MSKLILETIISWMPLIVVLAIVVAAVVSTVYVIPQKTVAVIERFGRFEKVSSAGIHVKVPLIDRIAGRMSLKVTQLDNTVVTKTKDNVFVTVEVPVQYKVNENCVTQAFYELSNPEQQIKSYVEDVLRTSISQLNIDETFENKDQIALEVQSNLQGQMGQFGFEIVNTLVTNIDPEASIKAAMNSINESERLRIAAQNNAEAKKITIVAEAEADAEAAKQRGLGIAEQRKAIVEGLAGSIEELKAAGLTEKEVISVLMTNQYLDTLDRFADRGNSSIFLPAAASGAEDTRIQILSALQALNGTAE